MIPRDTRDWTFLQDPTLFIEVVPPKLAVVKSPNALHAYLQSVTLESLLAELSKQGITQKAFAEAIGMSTRHLSTLKSSELRNHYCHELGATKLACLWVLEHPKKLLPSKK